MRRGNKKGELLVGNIIFIVLNLLFLTILFLFISQQGSGLILLEQSYAKQVALTFDLAKPGMTVFLDFEKGYEEIKTNFGENYDVQSNINNIIKINGNIVTVQLDKDERRKGYSYSFFNDIDYELKTDIRPEAYRKGVYFIFK